MARSWLCALFLGLALLASPAQAVTVSLTGSTSSIQSGGTISVDIVVSGFASGEFVSAFDLGVTFDPAQLSFVRDSFVVGTALGSVIDTDFFDFTDLSGADFGTLLPYVVSLLDDQMLASLQTGSSVVLGSFELRARPSTIEQTAAIGLTCNSVAGPLDGGGMATLLELQGCNGTTAVIQPVTAPEPETLVLFGFGLLALGWARRVRPVIQQRSH